MILIITNKEDVHPTPVIRYLRQKNYPFFRLNTEALLTDYEFRWECRDRAEPDFFIRNIVNGASVRGSDVTAVWERRPAKVTCLKYENRGEINRHNMAEANEFLSYLLYYVSDLFSIGHHLYDWKASSKMTQLKVAQELGMQVPSTCFSNRKPDILSFASGYDSIVLKSIDNGCVSLNDMDEYLFYTVKTTYPEIKDLPEEMFGQTVNFIQNYIEKDFELRITVVCDKVFACRIDSQDMAEDQGKIDWRQGYDYGLKHSVFALPERISAFCVEYLKRMKLNFGCFDFIVTPEGEYVFLECNPNGQWLWIEEETGMKISAAIAEALISHTNV